jgi:hypothetical protein
MNEKIKIDFIVPLALSFLAENILIQPNLDLLNESKVLWTP